MRDALRLAVGTLTRWPVPAPRQIDRATARTAMTLAPLVGLPLALVAWVPLGLLSWWRGTNPLTALLSALLAITLLAYLTRALHLDGLADTADALGSGRPAAGALEIARRSDVGPFGVVTVVLVLGLQVTALALLVERGHGLPALALAVVTARLALVWASTPLLPARPDGLGALFAGSVPLGVPTLWTLVLAAAVAVWQPRWLLGLAVAAAAAGVTLVTARRRFGGVTGDVLGATVEVTTAGVLVGLALAV